MKNLFYTVLGFLLLFVQYQSFSQENFEPGKIILSNGDTLNGFIDHTFLENNPETVSFKRDMVSQKIIYAPSDLKEFRVSNNVYLSGKVKVEKSAQKLDLLDYTAEFNLQDEIVFLEKLGAGPKSLFYYQDSEGKEHFYIEQGNQFELLLFKRYYKKINGQNILASNQRFVGQLILFLNDCPSIQTTLKDVEYNINSLKRVFSKYDKCVGNEVKPERKERKKSVEIGGMVGTSLSRIKFEGEDYTFLTGGDFPASFHFFPGLFVDIYIIKSRSLSLYSELTYNGYNVKGSYEYYRSETGYSITSSTLSYSQGKLTNQLRFRRYFGKLVCFANAGLFNGLTLSSINQRKIESRSTHYNDVSFTYAIKGNEIRELEQGYVLGIGARIKDISTEFRFERGNGMAKNPLKSTTTRLSVLLSYVF